MNPQLAWKKYNQSQLADIIICAFFLLYLFAHFHQEKRKEDDKKKKLRLALGEEAVPKGIPRTIENAREAEPNMITDLQDEDLVAEEQNDHYTQYYDKVR